MELFRVFAQSASGDDVLSLLDYINLGVLGVLVIAFMKMWIVPRGVLDEVKAERDKKEQELAELRTKLDQEVLPQLWKTTELLAQFAKINRDGFTQEN